MRRKVPAAPAYVIGKIGAWRGDAPSVDLEKPNPFHVMMAG